MSYCLAWDLTDFTWQVEDFSLVVTAANGDGANLDHVSSADAVEGDGWVDYGGELAFAGGTARFVGASGMVTGWTHDPLLVPPGFEDGMAEGDGPWVRELSATCAEESGACCVERSTSEHGNRP